MSGGDGAFVVLVTGCSDGGIGCEVARAFALRAPPLASGRDTVLVFAAARRGPDAMKSLAGIPNIVRVPLDVTDPASIARAMAEIDRVGGGGLDVLVNNAGVGCFGPVVEAPIATVRHVLDTNAVAPLALTQALLPLMLHPRGTRSPPAASEPVARVLNVGSLAGALCGPFGGVYSASKAALHMLSSALRMELRPLRVSVCTVLPGGVVSNIARGSAVAFDPARSLYAGLARFIYARANASQSARSTPTADMARRIVDTALRPGYMPASMTYGHLSTFLTFLSRLPYWLSDWLLMRNYGLWPPSSFMIAPGAK
ncbi:hypothetical protein HK405_003257 [Cladochytrium tenue]|nr:hypothetical protein HK405_003257 [Cladochytrium tenue]